MRCLSCGAKPGDLHELYCEESEDKETTPRAAESLFDPYWKIQDEEYRR